MGSSCRLLTILSRSLGYHLERPVIREVESLRLNERLVSTRLQSSKKLGSLFISPQIIPSRCSRNDDAKIRMRMGGRHDNTLFVQALESFVPRQP